MRLLTDPLLALLLTVFVLVNIEGNSSCAHLSTKACAHSSYRRGTRRVVAAFSGTAPTNADADVNVSSSGNPETTTVKTSVDDKRLLRARSHVLSVAERCNEASRTGVFLTNRNDKRDIKKAVAELEAICGKPTYEYKKAMVGDWTLLCTTNSGTFGVTLNDQMDAVDTNTGSMEQDEDKKVKRKRGFGIPFSSERIKFNDGTMKTIQDKIRKSVDVTQRIRTIGENGDDVINRVDNVVEFTPFDISTVSGGDDGGIIGNITSFLSKLPLNPFEVTRSKVSLVHKAEVESLSPVLRTRIALKSIILTVAGKSQYLDQDGSDVLGLNVPFGEFFNAGAFDTTYVDDDIRISRGTLPFLDELRVFVRKGAQLDNVTEVEDGTFSETGKAMETVVQQGNMDLNLDKKTDEAEVLDKQEDDEKEKRNVESDAERHTERNSYDEGDKADK